MTLELFFVAGSFVAGVVQVVEARVLLRRQGALGGATAYSSAIEFLWAVFCVYLLVAGRLESSRWLAIMFLAYIPIGIAIGFIADPQLLKKDPDTIRVPKVVAYAGGLFGALYASAALIFLVA